MVIGKRYWKMKKSVLNITTLIYILPIVSEMDEVTSRDQRHRFLCQG